MRLNDLLRRFHHPQLFLGAAVVVMLYAAFMHLHLLIAYPPGTDLDVGLNGLEALKPIRYGVWPFYILNNSNPDPLFIYLQSVTTELLGARIISLRLPSAFSGWLGFAVLYATLCELGRGEFDRVTRRRIALLAIAALASSQVLALLHRMGLRFSTAALFQMAALWSLSRAMRINHRRAWVIAGTLAGLTQYTYPTARVLPLLLLLVFLIKAAGRRSGRQPMWPGALLYLGVALAVLLPQVLWYVWHPSTLLARAGQTSLTQHPLYAEAGPAAAIWAKLTLYWEALGSYWAGQYNHIKEPLLAKLFFGGFVLGVGVALAQIWRRFVLVLICGLVVMVIPEMIAGASDWPHELRLIGAYPFVAAFVGLGLGGTWSALRRWPCLDAVAGVALAAAVMLTMYQQAREFFSLEFNYSKLYWNQNWWLGRIEAGVGTLIAGDEESYLLPLADYSRNAIKYLTANRARELRSALSRTGELLPELRGDGPVTVLLPNRTDSEAWSGDATQWVLFKGNAAYVLPPLPGFSPLLPPLDESTLLYGSGVEEIVVLGHARRVMLDQLHLGDVYRPEFSGDVCFQPGLCLTGASYSNRLLQAGQSLRVNLFWTAVRRIRQDYIVFVHLLDPGGSSIAGVDRFPLSHGYRTYEWRPDELILTTHDIPTPGDLRPGRYAIEVGLYALPTAVRVPTVNEAGAPGADRAVLANLKVPRPAVELPGDYEKAEITFGDELQLLGYRVDALPSGSSPLAVTLWWRALQGDLPDWTAFYHLTPESDNSHLAGQLDRTVSGGDYPPSVWDAGELVEEQIGIDAGALAPGRYAVWMGLYSPATLERAPITRSPHVVEDNRTLLLEFDAAPDS